jgi:hypothetical protein
MLYKYGIRMCVAAKKQNALVRPVNRMYTIKNTHVTQVVRHVNRHVNTKAKANVIPADAAMIGAAI